MRSIQKTQDTPIETEEQFRLLVQGVTDYAIYMLSPAGIVTSWNAGAQRIKGYSRAEITFLCEEEPLRRLSDLAFRRTAIAMEGLLTHSAIEELGRIAGATLGWSSERTAHEIAHTQAELQRRLPGLNPAA